MPRVAFALIHVAQGAVGDEEHGMRLLYTLYDAKTREPLPLPQGLCANTEDHRVATMTGLTVQAQELGYMVDWDATVFGAEEE